MQRICIDMLHKVSNHAQFDEIVPEQRPHPSHSQITFGGACTAVWGVLPFTEIRSMHGAETIERYQDFALTN
jgi:hypothetical protein